MPGTTLSDLQTYLAAYTPSLGLAVGTNLFRSILPPSPDLCVALYDTGGLGDEPALGTNGGIIRAQYPTVKAIARGAADDYDTPNALMYAIVAALAKVGTTTVNSSLSGTQYQSVMARQPPFEIARDDNHRVHIVCNFQIFKDF